MDYVFNAYDTAISWKINVEKIVPLSTTKIEYIVVIKALKKSYG